ncbi:hypothetical protein ES332_D02G245000v1 [Gossypium tomentosum]|uniref:Uncharacterized protein n=1 Tax=Gossypium tomentosum TaxID=34277 RepID=A0A5D2M1E0_GOSTO|nr:hypothetical protein ES332_D02G245000v1 [Gossypium tomentosum]
MHGSSPSRVTAQIRSPKRRRFGAIALTPNGSCAASANRPSPGTSDSHFHSDNCGESRNLVSRYAPLLSNFPPFSFLILYMLLCIWLMAKQQKKAIGKENGTESKKKEKEKLFLLY